jgi:hypothetical protein
LLLTAVGVLTLVGGVWHFYRDAILEPSISFEGEADVSSPLASPFTIVNRSSWFPIRSPLLVCQIERLKGKIVGEITNSVITDQAGDAIEPDSSASFRCKVGTGANDAKEAVTIPNAIASAHIFVRLSYKTLWFQRLSPETEFTWFTSANPPRWIKGKIAD